MDNFDMTPEELAEIIKELPLILERLILEENSQPQSQHPVAKIS